MPAPPCRPFRSSGTHKALLMPPPPVVTNAIRIRKEIASINPTATFIIVTKTQSMEVVQELVEAGFREFGENRVGQFVERQALLPEARWHFIGRLSRKNVAKVIGKAELIHSVDSMALLEKIERSCCAADELLVDTGGGGVTGQGSRGGGAAGGQCTLIQRVLLQVNVSGEDVKQGFSPDGLRELARGFDPDAYPHVRVEGLMTMAPFVEDEEILRRTFSALRDLRNEVNEKNGLGWNHLSMGMSNDYRIALEEGATMVRIGTVVFSMPPQSIAMSEGE